MSEIRRKAIEGLAPGDTFTVTRTFVEEDTQAFGKLVRDYNPVHYDQRFVAAKKLDALICHGLLVGGILTEIGGEIGWLASGMEFRFRKPVFFGDTITCVFTMTEVDERRRAKARAIFTNQHGTTVLEAGLTGLLPDEVERTVLAALLAEASAKGARDP